MTLRGINEVADFTGKRVLIRVDFNIALDDQGEIVERYKLDAAQKTIAYVLERHAQCVILMTHFGRPEGKSDAQYSLKHIQNAVEASLGTRIYVAQNCVGDGVEAVVEACPEGKIILLENLRFHAEEELNDTAFAQKLARLADVYVNEAFSVCHRAHASVVAITQYIESYAGLHLLDEVRELEALEGAPKRPAVAIIGGAKIETKLPMIRNFEKLYDAVLVGGRIATEAMDQQLNFADNVIFPDDFRDETRADIGPLTIKKFTEIIATAKTVIWNGPMGKIEIKPFDEGTNALVAALVANASAHTVIGGGESLVAVEHMHAINKMSFVSTGGGAMLEFLSGTDMPGLAPLKIAT